MKRGRGLHWIALGACVLALVLWLAWSPLGPDTGSVRAQLEANATAVAAAPAASPSELEASAPSDETQSSTRISQARDDLRFAELTIRAREEDGTAAPNVLISVEFAHDAPLLTARCDATGTAHFDALEPGRVAVRGLTRGLATCELEPGPNELFLVLPRCAGLTVRVVDESDVPIASADIHVGIGQAPVLGLVIGTSDASGTLVIPALMRDRVMFATKPGFEPSSAFPLRLVVQESESTLEIRMRAGGARIRGVVREAGTLAPVANALVRIASAGNDLVELSANRHPMVLSKGTFEVRTDREGRFSAQACGTAMSTVTVHANGFAAWSRSVVVRPGADEFLEVLLETGIELRGRVLAPSGEVVQHAVVRLIPANEREVLTAVTDARGKFRFRRMLDAAYRLDARGSEARRTIVELERLPETPLDIVLPASRAHDGALLDAAAAPVASWQIAWTSAPWSSDQGPYPPPATLTDAHGRFWLSEESHSPGWIYAWPSGVPTSMPVLAQRWQPGDPLELRLHDEQSQLGSIQLDWPVGDAPVLDVPLSARITSVTSGLERTMAVVPGRSTSFPALPSGAYRLHYQLGTLGWRDAGTLSVSGSSPVRAQLAEPSSLRAAPDGK